MVLLLPTVEPRPHPQTVTWFAPVTVQRSAAVQTGSTYITTLARTFPLIQTLLPHLRGEVMCFRSRLVSQPLGTIQRATCKLQESRLFYVIVKHAYSDNAFGRVLEYTQDSSNNMTVEACVATCQSQNFTLAGLEYTSQCCRSSSKCH